MLILRLKGLINEHKQENTTVLFIFYFLYRKWSGHVVIFQKNVPVKYLKTSLSNTVISFLWIFKTRNT